MSHEIYKNKDFYAAAVDIWALGVILFIMLTGKGGREGGREGGEDRHLMFLSCFYFLF